MLSFKVWLEKDATKTGKPFDDFTGRVVSGEFGRSSTKYQLAHPIGDAHYAHEEMQKHIGHFEDHISKSIPNFREAQIRKAHAIVKVFGDLPTTMLDIGGEEGVLAKTVTSLSKGRIQSKVLDPNYESETFFNQKSQVQGSHFDRRAFLQGWDDIDAMHADNHPVRYDIVHENMTFQFINNERATHIQESKRLLKPDGVLITQEKLITPPAEWHRNEQLKDAEHKRKYYSDEELAAKQKVVGVSFAKKEAPAKVNMIDNMVHHQHFEKILSNNFRRVIQFWDAGNFKGYVASDNPQVAQQLVSAIGNLNSKFSTVKTPRVVS